MEARWARLAAAGLTLATIGLACARPPDRPQSPTRPPAAAPPRTDQAPTEAPLSTEKGVINGLRFTPVFVGNSKESTATPEGFKKWEIALAAFNLSDQLRGRTSSLSGGRQDDGPLDNAIRFHVQSGNFSYPEGGVSFTSQVVLGAIPPGHGLRTSLHVNIPSNAKGLRLVGSVQSDRRNPPKEVASWDLEKDFPPFGQERKVDYFLADAKFKRLGEAIDQGPFKVELARALAAKMCGPNFRTGEMGGNWRLLMQFGAENKHGYTVGGHGIILQLIDDGGNLFSDSKKNPEVPPGMKKTFYADMPVATEDVCKPGSPPVPEPKHMRLLVALLPTKDLPSAWGVYDVQPAVIPPIDLSIPPLGSRPPDNLSRDIEQRSLQLVEKAFQAISK